MYVGSHLSGRRSETIEIRTKTSGRSKRHQNNDIYFNFILKTPEKALHLSFHFTGIRSRATGIITKITGRRSKIPQNDDDISNFIQKIPEWTKNRVRRYSFQWNKILSHWSLK